MRRSATVWLVRRAGLARGLSTMFVVGVGSAAVWQAPMRPVTLAASACVVVVVTAATLDLRSRAAAPWLLLLLALLLGSAVGGSRMQQLFGVTDGTWDGRACDLVVVATGPPDRAGGAVQATVRVRSVVSVDQGTGAGGGEAGGRDEVAGRGRVGPPRWDDLVGVSLQLEVGRPFGASGGSGGAAEGEASASLEQGMVLQVRGRLAEPPTGVTDGGFDLAARLRTRGVALVLEADPADIRPVGRRGGPAGLLDRLRKRSAAHLGYGLDASWASLLRGIVLGDKGEIPEPVLTAFRRSGTSHVLSVSGLHVASLAGAVFAMVGLLPVGRVARLITATVVVVAFALVTGAGPAVTRAGVMLLLWLLGRELGRGRDGFQLLAVAAAFVLVRNPCALRDPGAQLSFAAVAGLMTLGGPLQRGLSHAVPTAVASGAAVSLAATAATAPFALVHFDQVSLVGVVANLLVVPVVAPVMVMGLVSIAGGFVSPVVAGSVNGLASALLGWMVVVAEACARAPVMRREHVGVAVAASVGVAAVVPWCRALMGAAPAGRRVPGGVGPLLAGRAAVVRRWVVGPPTPGGRAALRPRSARHRLLAVVCLSVLVGASGGAGVFVAGGRAVGAISLAQASSDWPETVEVRVLDVGQGSAALLRTPEGHAVLIDAGPGGTGLYGMLRGLGVGRLDLVVLSHPHADHVAGLDDVVDRLRVTTVIDRVDQDWVGEHAPSVPEAAAYARLVEGLADTGTQVVEAAAWGVVRVDQVTLTMFAPPDPLSGSWDSARLNASSLVVLVEAGDLSVLLPGDAEAPVLERYGLPEVDVVVVPHHGSRDSVRATLLERMRPGLAVASVGRENPFGHPAADTLAVLRSAGVPMLRTDEAGWVAVAQGAPAEAAPRVWAEHPRGTSVSAPLTEEQ